MCQNNGVICLIVSYNRDIQGFQKGGPLIGPRITSSRTNVYVYHRCRNIKICTYIYFYKTYIYIYMNILPYGRGSRPTFLYHRDRKYICACLYIYIYKYIFIYISQETGNIERWMDGQTGRIITGVQLTAHSKPLGTILL